MPELVTFFITNRCNCNCLHCFYWKNLNKPKKELSLTEIEKISRTMGNFAFLTLTGGEPFLREDIADIATIFHGNNNVSRLSIPTNGLLTEKITNSVKKILKRNKNLDLIVKISLDGIGNDHDQIRGVRGCFKKAIDTYNQLKKLKKYYLNLKLGILITLFSLNQDKISNLYKFIKSSLNPDFIGLILIRGKPKNKSFKDVKLTYYKKLYSRILNDFLLKSRQKKLNYNYYIAYKLEVGNTLLKIVREKKYPMKCYAGTLSAVLDECGNVFPCELLNKNMGNLRNFGYDFKKLWLSKKAGNIREYIKKSKCFCTHECNLPINIFFNLKSLCKLLRNILCLKFTFINKIKMN
jgi:MoaA/NifB/PqqE/SkfB family radical SAM enzyme